MFFAKLLKVILLTLFIFIVIGSMSVVLGTTVSIIIGLMMLMYLFDSSE